MWRLFVQGSTFATRGKLNISFDLRLRVLFFFFTMSLSGSNNVQDGSRDDGGVYETELEQETRIAAGRQKEDEERILREGLLQHERDAANAERQRLERVAAVWLQRGRQDEVENWAREGPPPVRGQIFFFFFFFFGSFLIVLSC
jgi:hypothetical protein